MTEANVLVYIPDPYAVGNSMYFVGRRRCVSKVEGSELANIGPLVTFDVPTLVDDLRTNQFALPSDLTDISDAIRLYTGVSRADGGEKRWNFWKHIKKHFHSHADWSQFYQLHTMRSIPPEHEQLEDLAEKSLEALSSLWSETIDQLTQSNESERFFEIEKPVAQIFYNRQHAGIRVDTSKLSAFTAAASQQKYSMYQVVSDNLKISATGLNYWNIGSRLKATDLDEIESDVTGYVLRDRMKMAAGWSSFAMSFTKFLDASRDLDILARLADEVERVFPTIHTLGTISGRILLADPYLQELKRRYRSIICADNAKVLRYFDFSQFEPGIMASLSHDRDLISLYNKGDVYLELSRAVFNDDGQRSLCKRIFLSFSYGMSAKGIALLIAGKGGSGDERTAVEEKIRSFFDRFGTLTAFKANLEKRLLEQGYVSTLLGNQRKRLRIGALLPKERRWAVSQMVQGSASLIFKKSLLNVQERFGREAIVVPMHDAILMQFSNDASIAECENQTIELMKEAFHEYCPEVLARVTCGAFDI